MAKFKGYRIILPKEKDSAQIVLDYGRAVHKGMSAYPDKFPSPTPELKVLKDALDDLESVMVPEGDMSDNARNIIKQKKLIVLEILSKLAAYVIGVAGTDRYTAALSGFQLSKEETSSTQTGNIKVEYAKVGNNPGEAIVRLSDRGGHDMFLVYLKKPDGEFVLIDGFTKSRFTLKDLPSGSSVIRITGKKSDVRGASVETVVQAV